MKQNLGETTRTNYKMYKKGKVWLFSAAIICTGALGMTTVAQADVTSDPATMIVASASPTTTTNSAATTLAPSDASSASTNDASTAPVTNSTVAGTTLEVADSVSTTLAASTAAVSTDKTQATPAEATTSTATATPATSAVTPESAATVTSDAPVSAATTRTSPENPIPTEPPGAILPADADSIYNDAKLADLGIDVNHIDQNNALGIASLFHIFANSTELSTDMNGNIATADLIKGDTDFGTNHYDGDLFYIQNLSGTVLPNSFRANSSLLYLGRNIFAYAVGDTVYLNGVQLTHVTRDQVYRDTKNGVYIDFTEEFQKLRDKANAYYEETNSDGIIIDLADQNNQSVDATAAVAKAKADGTKYIYANVPLQVLMGSQPITIKGLASDGPTLIINVTEIDESMQGRASNDANIQTQVRVEVDGETLNAKERTDFSQSVLLWNFGTDHLDYDFIVDSGYFIGSVLAPNSSIIADVNMDGNLIADAVHIRKGESHRFDLQTPGGDKNPGTDPGDPGDPGTKLDTEDPNTEQKPDGTKPNPETSVKEDATQTKPAATAMGAKQTAATVATSSTSNTNISKSKTQQQATARVAKTELPQTGDAKQSTTIWGLAALAFTGLFGLASHSRRKNR